MDGQPKGDSPAGQKDHMAGNEEELIRWMDVLVFYAQDWDRAFDNRPSYFTQEYWYLLVGSVIHKWKGSPLTVSAACQMMKTGSNRTREDRIKKAVEDGYLVKEPSPRDGRTLIVLPSARLESLLRGHLSRTLEMAKQEVLAPAAAERRSPAENS